MRANICDACGKEVGGSGLWTLGVSYSTPDVKELCCECNNTFTDFLEEIKKEYDKLVEHKVQIWLNQQRVRLFKQEKK